MKKIEILGLRNGWSGLSLLTAFLFLGACSNSTDNNTSAENGVGSMEILESGVSEEAVANGPVGVMSFEQDAFEFGKVVEGEVVEHVFTFVNTGDAPLIISQVSASCGCTTPEFSTHPVAPGQEGTVKVVFDSNGQVGQQHKVISVLSNGSMKVTLLHLRGEVTPKA